jgi:uncharacterized protein
MLKRSLVAGFCALLLGFCAGSASAQPVSDDALAAARELMTVMRATDQFKALLPNVVQAMKPAVVQGRPDVEKDFDVIIPVLLDGMNVRVEELANELATVYARNFTAAEMRQITAFYRSAVGQRFVEKMPAVAQQSLPVGQAWGQKVAAELQGRIAEELRKRGH